MSSGGVERGTRRDRELECPDRGTLLTGSLLRRRSVFPAALNYNPKVMKAPSTAINRFRCQALDADEEGSVQATRVSIPVETSTYAGPKRPVVFLWLK